MTTRYSWSADTPEKIRTLQSYSTNPDIVTELITEGHADVHYRGSEETPATIEAWQEALYDEANDNVTSPDKAIIDEEIHRVSNEIVPASHFLSKTIMYAACSEALFACADTINKWITHDQANHCCRLCITANVGTFIGTGIGLDGNEYATTAVTIVLGRRDTESKHVGRIPFSVITMYPNITQNQQVGMLVATGRSYAQELAEAITTAGVGPKMAWALRAQGVDCFFDNRHYTPTTIVYGEYEEHRYMFRYNEHSHFQGQVLTASPQGFIPISQDMSLAPSQKRAIRDIEQEYHSLLHIARDKNTPAVSADTFPRVEPGILFNNNKTYEAQEVAIKE